MQTLYQVPSCHGTVNVTDMPWFSMIGELRMKEVRRCLPQGETLEVDKARDFTCGLEERTTTAAKLLHCSRKNSSVNY